MKVWLSFLAFFFLFDCGFAHMCHDPFRPREHLVLIPEKELISIEQTGEFRIYIENPFRSTLEQLRLLIESRAFDIEIEPKVLARLVSGERAFFLVKLKLREGFKPGNYPLSISVEARSAELRPTIERIEVKTERLKEKVEEEILPFFEEEISSLRDIEFQKERGETQKEIGEIVVKVEKIPFYKKPYFYLFFILLLLLILIWRKIRIR